MKVDVRQEVLIALMGKMFGGNGGAYLLYNGSTVRKRHGNKRRECYA